MEGRGERRGLGRKGRETLLLEDLILLSLATERAKGESMTITANICEQCQCALLSYASTQLFFHQSEEMCIIVIVIIIVIIICF